MIKRSPALRISLVYALAASLWIFFSDAILYGSLNVFTLEHLGSTLKGELFVLVTASLLFAMMYGEFKKESRGAAQYRNIFVRSPIPMWYFDKETLKFLEVNDAAIKHYGYSREEFLSMTILDVRPPEDAAKVIATIQLLESKTYFHRSGWHHKKKDGSLIEVETISNITLWRGQPAIVVTVLDISQIQKAEQALVEVEQLNLELAKEREQQETRSRFLNVVTHEFRTPLSIILTSAGSLESYYDRLKPEDRKQKFIKITESVKILDNMLDDMLSLYRLEAGRVDLKPKHFELKLFCERILDSFRQDDRMPHQFLLDFQNDTSLSLYLDDSLLDHVLTNLLTNAVKYSPQGGDIRLKVLDEGATVIVSISDQGIGIPTDELNHIFDPFFRASNAKQLRGTGLGLSIVQEYVVLLGGNVTCQSEVGKGTSFHLTLPKPANPQ